MSLIDIHREKGFAQKQEFITAFVNDEHIQIPIQKAEIKQIVCKYLNLAYNINERVKLINNLRESEIYKMYHQTNDWKATEENFEELKSAIDLAYAYFFPMLNLLLPEIKDHEIELCYLYKADITSISYISRYMNLTPQAISMKRDRLYEKIFNKKGNADLFEKFINSL